MSTAHKRTLSAVSEKSIVPPPVPLPEPTPRNPEDVVVPQLLQLGTPMTKVSAKKHKKFVFRLDADLGQIVWESKKHKIIPIENIKEIRSGQDARYYREQFQLAQDYEDRWLTIIYILDGAYKTLHLIVTTRDVFRMWDTTLRQLHAIRQELMSGLGNLEVRQALWEKQHWKGADEEQDQKLTFDEVEKLCKKLNINSGKEYLQRLFSQSDTQNRGYLDFNDFRRFVKLLKSRPDIQRLYNKVKAWNNDAFDVKAFQDFMRKVQGSELDDSKLEEIFKKYTSKEPTMTLDGFNTFLLSPDNSAFKDQHLKVHHDMTRPLPEYFISSSHNTYLVGHQLVGDSTIEGYIRALLHSCRSVEVDIYDGDTEPMIFHGKTFTSKVSLREVCQAIKKYGFVASPYPIVISAEVHCGLAQQDMIAVIMLEVFGDVIVRHPEEGTSKIEVLPSPEDLRGKILLKTKNLFLLGQDSLDADSSTDPSASSASASEAEFSDLPVASPPPFPRARISLSTSMREGSTSLSPIQDSPAAMVGSSAASAVPALQDVPEEKKKKASRRSSISRVGTSMLQRVRSMGRPSPSPSPSPSTQRAHSTPVVVTPTSAITSPAPVNPRRLSGGFDRSKIWEEPSTPSKPKMSLALAALLVYTVGVKWRGLNKKEAYAPEHMFSLSEVMMNKLIKSGVMVDLIKHTRGHLVRTYPKGWRVRSTNYEPHRFWAAGAQLVAINWQTFDLGYMINHAMFQRNGRSGLVLKPLALRSQNKDLLMKRTMHKFEVTIISAQQLPRPKNEFGYEIAGTKLSPYVEVSLYVPDWPMVSSAESNPAEGRTNEGGLLRSGSLRRLGSKKRKRSSTALRAVPPNYLKPPTPNGTNPTPPENDSLFSLGAGPAPLPSSIPGKTISSKTSVVKNNGFNPVWEETLQLPFECVGDMMDLIFVRFVVQCEDKDEDQPVAVYCASLGSLARGYRHLALHDSQLSQFLFSTLFVKINIVNV